DVEVVTEERGCSTRIGSVVLEQEPDDRVARERERQCLDDLILIVGARFAVHGEILARTARLRTAAYRGDGLIDLETHGDITVMRLNAPPVNALDREVLLAITAT